MIRIRSRVAALVLGVLGLALTSAAFTAPAWADNFTPGSRGLGDPFFPDAGNGGYDVSHYSLDLSYQPSTNQLSGTATITATATQNLSRFDLDLRGFTISRLDVAGRSATFTRDGQELIVTPRTCDSHPGIARSIPSGSPMYQSGWEPAVTWEGL